MSQGFSVEDYDEYMKRINRASGVENDVINDEMNDIRQPNPTEENSSSHKRDSVSEKKVIDKSKSDEAEKRAAPVNSRRKSVRIQEKLTLLSNARQQKSKGKENANRSTESAEKDFADESDFAEVTLNYANRKRKRLEPKKDTFSELIQKYFTNQTEMHIVLDDKVVKNSQLSATCTLCGETKQYQKSSVWNLRNHLEKVRKDYFTAVLNFQSNSNRLLLFVMQNVLN